MGARRNSAIIGRRRILFFIFLWAAAFPALVLAQTNQTDAPTEFQDLFDKANAGDARAQLRLGQAYAEGRGVARNPDEAIKWFYKAAGHAAPKSNHTKSAPLEKLTTTDGEVYLSPNIERAEPDGILITYKLKGGGFGMTKIRFEDLPADTQKRFGYSPAAEAEYTVQQEAIQEIGFIETTKKISETKLKRSEILSNLITIAATYHETHTYLTNETGNIYVCGDMACDVWNMVVSKGISAKIVAGNVEQDITTMAQANHAWVLADAGDGEWLALEATAGIVIRPDASNNRYFYGCRFANAKEFRDFEHLEREYNDALNRARNAATNYKDAVEAYNISADLSARPTLRTTAMKDEAVVQDRMTELKQLKQTLDAFHLTNE